MIEYLDLPQTLDYLREHLPAPFDLPQLSQLCRQGDITPLFAYDGLAKLTTKEHPTNIFVFSGYVTDIRLASVIDYNNTTNLSTVTIFNCLNSDNQFSGETMRLLADSYNPYLPRYEDFNGIYDDDRLTTSIAQKDLRFNLMQMDNFISSLANVIVSFAPLPNYRAEIDHLTAENQQQADTIRQLNEALASQPNTFINDEPTHHKSVGSMQSLIATLIKMAEYDKEDLAEPYGELNNLIVEKSQILGLEVKNDFVAKWLKKADDIL